jgi:hypothetical protein
VIGKETVAWPHGSGRDAPFPAIASALHRQEGSTDSGHHRRTFLPADRRIQCYPLDKVRAARRRRRKRDNADRRRQAETVGDCVVLLMNPAHPKPPPQLISCESLCESSASTQGFCPVPNRTSLKRGRWYGSTAPSPRPYRTSKQYNQIGLPRDDLLDGLSSAEELKVRVTLRWREMDSNFQCAGAVNLVVGPFVSGGCADSSGSAVVKRIAVTAVLGSPGPESVVRTVLMVRMSASRRCDRAGSGDAPTARGSRWSLDTLRSQ